VVEAAKKFCPNSEYPIVLICDAGVQSMTTAQALIDLGYRNVNVLKGGVKNLSSRQPGYSS
jgi:rhodanese-related sulfurtransferase